MDNQTRARSIFSAFSIVLCVCVNTPVCPLSSKYIENCDYQVKQENAKTDIRLKDGQTSLDRYDK